MRYECFSSICGGGNKLFTSVLRKNERALLTNILRKLIIVNSYVRENDNNARKESYNSEKTRLK